MDDNTLSALRTQLVQLIINQGTIFSNWIKFAITVQGALAAGLGFALSDAKYRVFGLIIALLGIVTSLGFAAILVRQAQWLMWFAQRWNSLAMTSEIFPTRPGEIVRLNPGSCCHVGRRLSFARGHSMDRDFCGGSSERSPGRGRRVIGEP